MASKTSESGSTTECEELAYSAIEKSTAVGQDFLDTRSSASQQEIEGRAALSRGRVICRDWLDALPTGEMRPLALINGEIPDPAESMGHKACSAATRLTRGKGQMAEGDCNPEADEYALALSWELQLRLEHQKGPGGCMVQSELFELPTGYAVEISVGKRLIEQRHFVEDVVDNLRRDDTPLDPDQIMFLAARHSDEQCFVCEKLSA